MDISSSDIQVIENQWIFLDDGRRLAARIWLPIPTSPSPAILEYLPYRKRDGTAPRDETTHRFFAAAGYACVRVDIAGTGDSDGMFDDEYSEQELSDGEEVLAWIAEQDWCDGNIGMIGISWGGFNGLQLAFRQPKSLKAVVSVASVVDRYFYDIHYMDGCLLSDNINWSTQIFAYQTRPPDPALREDWRERWLERLENTPFSAVDWQRHPNHDDFWKHGSVIEDWSAIQIPVLAMTGWADAYINAPTALVANLTSPSKAMMGPWEHRLAHISKLAPADFHSEVLRWFDRWLKGTRNDAEKLPDYRVFIQEHFNPTKENKPPLGRWAAEAKWPSPNITPHLMYPCGGKLLDQAGEGEAVVVSPAHTGQVGGYFMAGMRIDNELAEDQAPDDALSLCFDTPPLDKPLELLGRPKLKIAFSVDKPVAQITARLCDVSPQGVSQRITYRAFNLTHYANHETPKMLGPGQRYEAEILLTECAHRLREGHILRLALSSCYWPIVWPAGEATKITLYEDGCALTLPHREVDVEIDAMQPGPPQNYPTLQGEQLREMASTSDRTTQDDGTMVLDAFDDFGKMCDPYHGLIVGSSVKMHYAIHPEDPASAAFESFWNFTFERDDWQVEINTTGGMTCDTENFYLYRQVHATEGRDKTEVFSKQWSQTIPRGLL